MRSLAILARLKPERSAPFVVAMPPADPTAYSSRPPAPERPRPPTATSLSALAHSQNPPDGAPSLPASNGEARGRALLPYVSVAAIAAMGVVGGLYVYRSETAPKPIILHGSPGVRHTPDGKAIRWRTRATTVYIDSSVDRLGPEARDTVRKAFGTWVDSDAPLPALTFGTVDRAEARLKSDGKNTVLFAPITIEGHEKDLAITITYSDEKTGNVVEADVVINAAYPFAFLDRPLEASSDGTARPHDGENGARDARADTSERGNGQEDESGRDGSAAAPRVATASNVRASENSSCVVRASEPSCNRDVYDVENVLSHEVGHFFGLGEEMSDTSATMYLCTNRCETHKRELTIVDRAAVAWLYAKEPDVQDDESVGCGGAEVVRKGTPHHVLSFMLVALALAAARWSGRVGRRTARE